MARFTILKAKTQFSQLVRKAEAGDEVIIYRGDTPVARLVPFAAPLAARRFGALKGLVHVTDAFFEPLDDEELALWEGR